MDPGLCRPVFRMLNHAKWERGGAVLSGTGINKSDYHPARLCRGVRSMQTNALIHAYAHANVRRWRRGSFRGETREPPVAASPVSAPAGRPHVKNINENMSNCKAHHPAWVVSWWQIIEGKYEHAKSSSRRARSLFLLWAKMFKGERDFWSRCVFSWEKQRRLDFLWARKETTGTIGKKTEAEPELENASKGVREHKGKGDRKKYWQSLDIHISHPPWPACSLYFIEPLCAGGTAWQASSFKGKYGPSHTLPPLTLLSLLFSVYPTWYHSVTPCACSFPRPSAPIIPYFFPPGPCVFIGALRSTHHVSLPPFYPSSCRSLNPLSFAPLCPHPSCFSSSSLRVISTQFHFHQLFFLSAILHSSLYTCLCRATSPFLFVLLLCHTLPNYITTDLPVEFPLLAAKAFITFKLNIPLQCFHFRSCILHFFFNVFPEISC